MMKRQCSKCGVYTIDNHIEAMKKYVNEVRKNETPAQANAALVRIGVLEKDGITIAERHRMEMKN
jgi:hypothetical protein